MCFQDARKRALASEELSRPQKRRSRDDNQAAAYIERTLSRSEEVSVLSGSTLASSYPASVRTRPGIFEGSFEPKLLSLGFRKQSQEFGTMTLPMQGQRSSTPGIFGSAKRRLSETWSKGTRRLKDSISHPRLPREDPRDDPMEVDEPPSAGLTTLRSYDSTLGTPFTRPFELSRSPPMRTSSLDYVSSRDPSPAGLTLRSQRSTLSTSRRRPIERRDSSRLSYLQDSDRESGISLTPEPEIHHVRQKFGRMTGQSRADPVDKLPHELIIQVFCHLNAKELSIASQVSSSWQKFTADNHVCMSAFMSKYEPVPVAHPLPLAVGGKGIGARKSDGSRLPAQEWSKMYRARKQLDYNWENGIETTKYLFGHTDSVYCVQFDEHKAITGSRDRTIRVWDLHTMTCTKVIGGPNAYDQDQHATRAIPEFTESMTTYLNTAGRCRWHIYPSRSVYHVPSYYHRASILCLQFDDEIMVTGSSDSTLIIWDIKTFEPRHILRRHTSGVLDLAFDADKIVSCSKDFTICVWDRRTGDFLHQISGHQGPVNAVQLRGNLVVSASGEGSSHLYDLNFSRIPGKNANDAAIIKIRPELINEFWSRDRGLACIEFSDDGRYVVAGGNDHLIFKYDTQTPAQETKSMTGHDGLVRSLYLDGANGRIISGSYDMSIKVWDFETGKLVRTFDNRTTSWMLSAKSDYRRIVATSQDGRVAVLDFGHGVEGVDLLESKKPLPVLKLR